MHIPSIQSLAKLGCNSFEAIKTLRTDPIRHSLALERSGHSLRSLTTLLFFCNLLILIAGAAEEYILRSQP